MAVTPRAPMPSPPAAAVWPAPPRRRGWRVPVAAGAVVLLLLGAGALVLFRAGGAGGPRLTASPGTVRRGGTVRVDATGFATGRAFVGIGSGGSGSMLAGDVGTGSGSWSTTVTIPAALAPGRYPLRACNAPAPGTGCATTSINVTR